VKCDRCDNEATVHELTVHNRKRQERHLCEACAKALGMAAGGAHAPPGGIPITHLLNQFITSQIQGTAAPGPAQAPAGVCRTCGLTLNQFRQTGLLGCPDCYTAFESQLAPLLQKAHEGASQHTGKRPARLRNTEPAAPARPPAPTRSAPARAAKSAPATPSPASPAPDPTLIAATLRKKLAEAVADERYEDAAKLRDELLKLQAPAAPAPAKAARKPGSSPRSPKSPPAAPPPKQPPADPMEGPPA
jgi:protein arginine kinase activator